MERMQSTKLKNNNLTQLLAIGSIAIASIATVSAAPASAVTFNTGELDFGVFVSPFGSDVNPGAGDTFNVTFNPSGTVNIFNNPLNPLGSFSPTFTAGSTIGSNSPTVGFSYVSGSTYKLDQDLVFNFAAATPTSFTLKQNSTFTETDIFNATNQKVGAGLQLASNAGSFFTNGGDTTNVPTLTFSFNDSGLPTNGLYITQASPTAVVPEPFTIIGTIVGGTAAFRMRKKLAVANKK
jgi:hypothetical protein